LASWSGIDFPLGLRHPVLSRNPSGPQDAPAAPLVVFSTFADTPGAGGYWGWKGRLSGQWTGFTCRDRHRGPVAASKTAHVPAGSKPGCFLQLAWPRPSLAGWASPRGRATGVTLAHAITCAACLCHAPVHGLCQSRATGDRLESVHNIGYGVRGQTRRAGQTHFSCSP